MSSAMAVENVENLVPAKMTAAKLDSLCEQRETLRLDLELINKALSEQVEHYGFTPPRADKSKRVVGDRFQVTLSFGETTEIRDTAVEAIERACPLELFSRLFRKVTQYKLTSSASMVLAGTLPSGAPSNLRKLFAQAVILRKRAPSLKVARLGEAD